MIGALSGGPTITSAWLAPRGPSVRPSSVHRKHERGSRRAEASKRAPGQNSSQARGERPPAPRPKAAGALCSKTSEREASRVRELESEPPQGRPFP